MWPALRVLPGRQSMAKSESGSRPSGTGMNGSSHRRSTVERSTTSRPKSRGGTNLPGEKITSPDQCSSYSGKAMGPPSAPSAIIAHYVRGIQYELLVACLSSCDLYCDLYGLRYHSWYEILLRNPDEYLRERLIPWQTLDSAQSLPCFPCWIGRENVATISLGDSSCR